MRVKIDHTRVDQSVTIFV